MKYRQTSDRFSADAVLLSRFVRPKGRICELCAGGGIVSLLLAGLHPRAVIDALELDGDAAEIMRENFSSNGLSGRLTALQGDLRACPLPGGGYGTVVCNPPYFAAGGISPTRGRARSELCCSIDDVCACSARLLAEGGRFFAVYRAERLAALICAMRANGIEPKCLRFVRHRPGAPCSAVLAEGRRRGGEGLSVQPDLIMFESDGSPTAEYSEIYGGFL